MFKKYFPLNYLAAILLLFNSCARNPVTGKRQVVLMSEAQEIAMGKQADPEIVAQFGLYDNKELQAFITEKGKLMAAASHRPNLNYEFKIVDSDVLNAFAVPGGYVYFTRGIMAHFNNEAEFAGVLGHEIGHITARHSVAQQRNALLGQLGIIAGMVISPEFGRYAETASQGLSLLLLKFGRDAERESDKLGVEYSSKIGYDATEMADFFNTLERKGAESGSAELPTFLSTHPNPGDRNVAVAKLATEWKQKLNLTNAQVNRNTYLKRIEGLLYGEDPKQGFVENNTFYHPVLKFQFPIPQNWSFQNTPQRVQMAPKDGKAMMMLELAPGKSIEEAASAIVQKNGLRVLDSRQLTVNGLNAISMVTDPQPQQQTQQSQQTQQPIRLLSYVIQFAGNNYHILGVTSSTDFNNYANVFSYTMQGFKELKDQSKINKKPERVRLKTISKSTTLQQALRNYKVPDKRHEEMAILNGMKLTENVTAGTMIKVIEQ